jgi:hypothetical protein
MHRLPRVALALLLLLLGPAASGAGPAPEAALATLERWVRTTFFPTARPAERGARWDIPAEANPRFGNLPVRLAAGRSGGALELGEALRLYPATEPFLLVAGFWSADGDGARFVSVHAVRIEPERWRALWEPVAFADLKRFDDLCRDPARPIEETRRLALRRRAEEPYRSAAIRLQPRLDDRQRRLDATLRAEEFRPLLGSDEAAAGAPALWGTPWADPRIR